MSRLSLCFLLAFVAVVSSRSHKGQGSFHDPLAFVDEDLAVAHGHHVGHGRDPSLKKHELYEERREALTDLIRKWAQITAAFRRLGMLHKVMLKYHVIGGFPGNYWVDINGDGIPDIDEHFIPHVGHRFQDDDFDGIPDEYQHGGYHGGRGFKDLNHNGIPDDEEGFILDLNHNGIPDDEEGYVPPHHGFRDQNHNGIPDSEEGYYPH